VDFDLQLCRRSGDLVRNARLLTRSRPPIDITSLKVNWHEGYANRPTFAGSISREPEREEWVYERGGPDNCLYRAQVGPLVRFYYYKTRGEGFGGRHFTILLSNGEYTTLEGPWSSNHFYINENWPPCVPFTHDWFSDHIALDSLISSCEHFDIPLWKVKSSLGVDYEPGGYQGNPDHIKPDKFFPVEKIERLA